MTTIPPPKTDELAAPDIDRDSVQPRAYADLVVGIMEAKDLAKPAAEQWVDEHGRVDAEVAIQRRWLS